MAANQLSKDIKLLAQEQKIQSEVQQQNDVLDSILYFMKEYGIVFPENNPKQEAVTPPPT
jgi:hypothetical protein